MNINKENLIITHYLSVFSFFYQRPQFSNFKGNLINDISEYLELTLEVFPPIGRENIIKTNEKNKELFEIKLSSNSLIYQDNLPLEKFIENLSNIRIMGKNIPN